MSSMMIATRGGSASAAPQKNRTLAARKPRAITLLGAAVHYGPRMQVLHGLGQLQVRLAVENPGKTQIGKARRVRNKHVGSNADAS